MDSKYKLTEANLNLRFDLNFIDNVLQCYGAQAEPDARRYLLDLSYTMARNQLVEARRFANLNNKTFIDVKDLRIAKMEKTDDFQFGPLLLAKPIVQPLSTPSATTSLLLPPWRNCQVGANAELKQVLAEMEGNNLPENGAPPSKMARIRLPNQPKMI
ncbi:uncharacterized protein [Drosophila virilis]|uniref:Uncharacterized protein, isoform A n=1 Tax=Drosophila virilis TaxID=7244 RepID=B4LUT5_DROVI|nr:uncharacterized protein Dvir_GJ23513, isoform A [Drosophila virilis]KRF81535.1 uncharacterized protein Dvir_GJ23513, isoform B [Drosophila virilis]